MSFCLNDIWSDKLSPGKKPGIKPENWDGQWLETVHLPWRQQSTSKKSCYTCRSISHWYYQRNDRQVRFCNDINQEHSFFGGDVKIFLISIIYKMQITVLKNDSKDLILGMDTEKLYSIFEFRDPWTRVHPSCHLYLLLLSNESIQHKNVQPLYVFGSWR